MAYVKDEGVEFIDIRFWDLPGSRSIPPSRWARSALSTSRMESTSTVRRSAASRRFTTGTWPGFQTPVTAYLDPFRVAQTLCINFFVHDPLTRSPTAGIRATLPARQRAISPRPGSGDTWNFVSEAEFYMFDDVRFETKQQTGYYAIDSIAGAWNTGRIEDGGNRARGARQGRRLPVPPVSTSRPT